MTSLMHPVHAPNFNHHDQFCEGKFSWLPEKSIQ